LIGPAITVGGLAPIPYISLATIIGGAFVQDPFLNLCHCSCYCLRCYHSHHRYSYNRASCWFCSPGYFLFWIIIYFYNYEL